MKPFSSLMCGRFFATSGKSLSYIISGTRALFCLLGEADSGSESKEQVSQLRDCNFMYSMSESDYDHTIDSLQTSFHFRLYTTGIGLCR